MKRFQSRHPRLALPPPYLLYESFKLDYQSYYESGRTTARWLQTLCEPYIEPDGIKILDWGCGPARVIRHFPSIYPDAEIHGTDYNRASIKWCQQHIPEVQFQVNMLDPPTAYPDQYFQFIYGISIFTHLSLENHQAWIKELHRILAADGIVLLTTHGDIFQQKLTPNENQRFQAHELIIRKGSREGHRTYTAFHPPREFRRMLSPDFQVLEHIPGKKESWGLSQDVWIGRRVVSTE